ncbi:MAG: type II toxin-antitoxin system VapC family toxin [Acidobacteriota bacterium]|nr:type II toxin-antitoxin system VapC family toxin [Acidobacteriota bacterium]
MVAILTGEPSATELVTALAGSGRRLLSSATLVETSIVLEARHGEMAARELDLFLHRAGVQTVAVDTEQVAIARAAWRRYGKGRHPAGLNLGDLFAYALAKSTHDDLLYVGDDFPETDVAAAL